VLVAALVLGAVLGAGASGWPSAALAWLMPRRAGDAALDFPVMNYEGGMQQVDVGRWRLRVTGAVANPLELSEDDLLALPWTEHTYAMNCVTGWSATRTWRGVSVATLLAMARADPGWGHADVRSTSGYHWDHRRSDLTLAGTLLCTHINGVRLNDAHGYPLRLVIPGTVGESNIKWVDGIHVATGAPELYLDEHLDFSNPTVTGPLLPDDPAGRPA
jgi:DMSO/TMAO reductase YedYZ molybdopterin-dependent catalytic subunit